MEAKPLVVSSIPDLHLAFDVGHSSLGWAVLKSVAPWPAAPEILGTGVVTFAADDCLASKRRQYRRQRRHIRSTRQRIRRMERLLAHVGALSESELRKFHRQAGGDSFAWRRAAEILRCVREGKPIPVTGWKELWDILRWYAHNRGYDGNRRWARNGEEEKEDAEKVTRARGLMTDWHTESMAETVKAYSEWYEQEVIHWKRGKRSDKPAHFKGLGVAFPREVVVAEVRRILEALSGRLTALDSSLIRALLGNTPQDSQAWRAVPVPGLLLPRRYEGGLLFGQLVPRFDNRIIGVCPIWFARREAELRAAGFSADEARQKAAVDAKLPLKRSWEFLQFRWAMQLANLFGAAPGETETRPLTARQRQLLTQQALERGGFTPGEFKKAVRAASGWARDNLDETLMHPDADRALILDPVRRAVQKAPLAPIWSRLSPRVQARITGRLRRGHRVTLAEIRDWEGEAEGFEELLDQALSARRARRGKGESEATLESILQFPIEVDARDIPSGRAPYARPVLLKVVDEILNPSDSDRPRHPRERGGCLEMGEAFREAQLRRDLVEQTNNHLVRHRLLLLERLFSELVASPEFASGDKGRIAGITIEVNRDLKDLSGKTAKEIAQDLGIRMGDFSRVAAKVEAACMARGIPVTAGLIRKARIAEDLGWKCPYTAVQYCMDDLIEGRVDKDHIIPRADRQSDSLDSLVITFSEVNRMKGRRTALQFITEDGGKPVSASGGSGFPTLSIQSLEPYRKWVETLDTRKGHDDDKARKRRRKERLLVATFEEKEFMPKDLTVTSHLVRLGAQVLERQFLDRPREARPRVISLPGAVTGEVRKAWDLLGCLATAAPATAGKTKTEIRGITHLHHALDACVLGLASWYFPANGTLWAVMARTGRAEPPDGQDRPLWRAMTQRRPSAGEVALLRGTGLYRADASGRLVLSPLDDRIKEAIRLRLGEKRVVQHVPADMSGLKMEENTRRLLSVAEGRASLRQQSARDGKTGVRKEANLSDERVEKLLGLVPVAGVGKLNAAKGVRVITENFGVAILDHAPTPEEAFVIIPWHRVWHRIHELRSRNGGELPRVLRNGMLVRIEGLKDRMKAREGVWRVFSVQQSRKLDLGAPDRVQMEKKGVGVWREVSLDTLGPKRIRILPGTLIGWPVN